ncbi:MAG: glycosyltransferase family 2 protein [Planctomyces sp.]|nr:glycosyltransferase family 2 protein [Planctomyces sp.]
MPRLTVVVPTFQEAANLPQLVHRVHDVLSRESIDYEMIVVDDNSPDETRQICQELAEKFPLRLIVRTAERGLSSAVVAGMNSATGELLVCMDADLSHPPEAIPELVAALENPQTDFVIGSRYVRGGSTEDGWGLLRWLNSKSATLLARPLTAVRDPMAGFFGLRSSAFQSAENLNPIGYKIGLELLVKCNCQCVKEIPIRFANRLYGDSKLSIREQLCYLRHLRRLYRFRFGVKAKAVEYGLVGLSGACADLCVLWGLMQVLPFNGARPLAICSAVVWNFWLNRDFTFEDGRSKQVHLQFFRFVVACLSGATVNWLISMGLQTNVPAFERNPLLAAVVGISAGAGMNFAMCLRFVFRPIANARSSVDSSAIRTHGSITHPRATVLDEPVTHLDQRIG